MRADDDDYSSSFDEDSRSSDEDIEEGGLPPDPTPRKLADIKETTLMEKVMGGIGVCAVGAGITAMVIEQSAIVITAGIITAATGPYAYWQQTRLTDVAALKETHEAIEREVDRLSSSNDRLHRNVKRLGNTADRLEDVEQALDVITQTQGESIDALAEQVKENQANLSRMEKNLKANVLLNILSVIHKVDKDGDHNLDDKELDDLVGRLKNINGVELREDRFRQAIKGSGGSLSNVMDILKNLLSDDVSEEDQIFICKGDDD